MHVSDISVPVEALSNIGINGVHTIHYQLPPDELVQDTLRMGEGKLCDAGALVIRTGEYTGRAPKDKFLVKDEVTENTVDWNEANIPITEFHFNAIYKTAIDYINKLGELWIQDCGACADPRYHINIRVFTEKPWVALFAHNMFLRSSEEELENFEAEWTIMSLPDLKLNPQIHGTRQSNAAVISFKKKVVIIAGTGYTGETKKGIFTVLNYLLPQKHDVLSMHCAANMGKNGDTALFFGLSGTGKTTLSADPERILIGDDEHGWTNDNIFNFEGGCYAKVIDLSEEREPDIFHAIRPGALVENTGFYPGTNTIDFSNRTITENTRVSYPLHHINNTIEPSIGNIPTHIFFLTCDAYGVLPPISRLTPQQAMYQFISGYTAKVAGTEAGVTEPKSTFSACFGAPFLPLHPGRYAAMLGQRLKQHNVHVWMVNTGWTGGPYGTGNRIKLDYTRAMISAAMEGKLNDVQMDKHPVFGMEVPVSCPGVPYGILNPKNTWKDSSAYDKKANELAKQFIENFEKYKSGVDEAVVSAGPVVR